MTDFEKEWAKMLNGEIYKAADPEFGRVLMRTREAIHDFNALRPSQIDEMQAILRNLLGAIGDNFIINQPFRCDFGCNIFIGNHFFANFNLTILDEARVEIGDHVFIGPNVSIFTACHPLDIQRRNTGDEWAEPVKIGNSVWIGGGATILPGVSIGDGAVIGAGAMVTKDVEPLTAVAGNPARLVRRLG